jgi:NitT/TauT family transport system substrate-binding protein
MKYTHKLLLGSIFVVLLFVTNALFAADTIKILAPRSTSSLPLLQLAVDDPLPGIDIQTETFVNHPQALALLLKGEVDFLFTGTSQGWNNYLDGGPMVMINTGVWGVSYLIGKDESIKTLADLKGKKLALPFPGAPLDFQTRYMLQKQGVDPDKDLEISYSPFPQTVPKLLAGQVDVAPLPEPLATNLVKGRGLLRLLDYQQAWADVAGGDPKSPQVSLFSTNTYVAEHADLIAALVEAWGSATQKVQDNSDDVAKQFTEALGVPAAMIAPAIQYTLFWLPSSEDNQQRVLAYYDLVNASLPEPRQALTENFFFNP